jgi:hypothetical protein
MQTEQYTPQTFDQPAQQRTGTTFEHGAQIDLHASDLASLEAQRARADIDAATRPLEEAVQQRMEYRPLSPQEVVKMIGRKVVFDLRKGYNETHINLFDDNEAATSYLSDSENDQPDQYSIPTKEELVKRAEGLSKDDVGLTA